MEEKRKEIAAKPVFEVQACCGIRFRMFLVLDFFDVDVCILRNRFCGNSGGTARYIGAIAQSVNRALL